MRFATYRSSADGKDHVALVEDDRLLGLAGPEQLIALLGDNGERLATAGERARRKPFEEVSLAEARLRAPIPVPPSVRDFMAFEEHVRNARRRSGGEVPPVWYEQPIFYFSNPAAVRGARDEVEISPGSTAFDYELEMGAVIGRAGCNMSPDEAERCIAGFFVLCDWSARDVQRTEMTVGLGPVKGKDGATSLGPFLVTPDELEPRRKGNGYDLEMTASVNGTQWTRGNCATVNWSFGQMLSYASRGTELRPGDVIGSGTVGGGCIAELQAIHGSDAYPWLQAGDEVCLEITELGAIEARILPAPPVTPLR